jgi:hypothetical protein
MFNFFASGGRGGMRFAHGAWRFARSPRKSFLLKAVIVCNLIESLGKP